MFAPGLARTAFERLALAGCVAADEEAGEMLAAAPDPETLDAWISRRERGEPLAWITGRLDFLGRTVHVQAGVYVPRSQSGELATRAARLLPEGGRAADLCTGAGAVAAHLLSVDPTAAVIATDIDPRAAACARGNGVAAVVADLDSGLRSRAFDVVTAVAPYVPTGEMRLLPADVVRYEPRLALDGGPDGLDVVRRLAAGAARLLHPGGWLLTEVGGDQGAALAPVLATTGFDPPLFWYDEDGDLRGLVAQMVGGPSTSHPTRITPRVRPRIA
ncbi:MAG: N5-glutamine methyltransferase family protein [Acidimicrobiales bacterium]